MAGPERATHDRLVAVVLPPAIEVMAAWSLAEDDGDPTAFTAAMERVVADAAGSGDPQRGMAGLLFGLSSLSGILLDQLAELYGVTRPEVLQTVHRRYLGEAGS